MSPDPQKAHKKQEPLHRRQLPQRGRRPRGRSRSRLATDERPGCFVGRPGRSVPHRCAAMRLQRDYQVQGPVSDPLHRLWKRPGSREGAHPTLPRAQPPFSRARPLASSAPRGRPGRETWALLLLPRCLLARKRKMMRASRAFGLLCQMWQPGSSGTGGGLALHSSPVWEPARRAPSPQALAWHRRRGAPGSSEPWELSLCCCSRPGGRGAQLKRPSPRASGGSHAPERGPHLAPVRWRGFLPARLRPLRAPPCWVWGSSNFPDFLILLE